MFTVLCYVLLLLIHFAHANSLTGNLTARQTGPVDIRLNLGRDPAIADTRTVSTSTTISDIPSGIPRYVFSTARYGKNFTYSFDVPPGAYDVTIGLVEVWSRVCSGRADRLFSIFVNGVLQVESYNIFAEAGGCHNAKRIDIRGIAISSADTKPLTVRFLAVTNNAQVAYLRIRPATGAGSCIPESISGTMDGEDHAAHAVPGSYPPQIGPGSPLSYVDHDGDGSFSVTIDGRSSHTHFSDPSNGIRGRLTSYTWTLVETGQVISSRPRFTRNFPLGTTRLRLRVVDNSCDESDAETTVTVTGRMQSGQYCYYYRGTPTITPAGLQSDTTPQYADVSTSLDLSFPSLPFPRTTFITRCFFFLDRVGAPETVSVSVDTNRAGHTIIYKGADAVLDTRTFDAAFTELPTGLSAFEVVHVRDGDTRTPRLRFLVNGRVPGNSLVRHDQGTILPIITAIEPNTGRVTGGTRVKVSGYGLYLPQTVTFGSRAARVESSGASKTQFFVASPSTSSAGSVPISTTSSGGLRSNSMPFTYGGSTCDDIRFQKTSLYVQDGSGRGEANFMPFATAVTLGPDRRLYVASLRGSVDVVGYDMRTFQISTHCTSPVISDSRFTKSSGELSPRVMLGIAFNPRETGIFPYVAMSTINWYARQEIDRSNARGWMNGAVERLRVTTGPGQFRIGVRSGHCLAWDRNIVRNLPVSNKDHLINALLFTQDGDLLIGVGGATNMGLPGRRLGNMWESPLSAAIVVARLSRPGFDGTITYSSNVHFLARQTGGDVEVYASGFRNIFTMTMTRSGAIYAADNGPNCDFGHASIGCDDFNRAEANRRSLTSSTDWQGRHRFAGESGTCEYGPGRRDKIMHIEEGKFYGHPNIQRNVAGECAWIDPFTDKTATGANPPSNYERPMTITRSSVTGIAEYRSSHFCSRLQGELILNLFKGLRVFRMSVSGRRVLSGPDVLADEGGMQFVEDPSGNMVFSRYDANEVVVLRPRITTPTSLTVTGVWPWRQRRQGGNELHIGGYNFAAGAEVYVGDEQCTISRSAWVTPTVIRCLVPALPRGRPLLADVKVVIGGSESVLTDAVLYMRR